MTEKAKKSKGMVIYLVIIYLVGSLVLLLGLTADIIGIGMREGFGPGQIIMVIVGVIILLYGKKANKS